MNFIKEYKYSDILNKNIPNILKENKILILRDFNGDNLFSYYEQLTEEIGWVPMDEDLSTGNKTGNKWIEIKHDPAFPLSYRHSSTDQPLHTDGSYEKNAPDISFFFCIKAAKFGGATTFLDSNMLLEILEYFDSDLFVECMTKQVTFYKGNDFKIKSIISADSLGPILTWNYFRVDHIDFVQKFHEFLEQKIVKGGLCFPVYLKPGDSVFFNDERLLHGRNSYIGDRFLLKGGLCLTK
jgi:alpha-ketoglutarate-dependent taurine dioxygenase